MLFDNSADIGFNQSEYILRESVMNHTVPVSITGGRLPIDTSVQVQAEVNRADTAGIYKLLIHFTCITKTEYCEWSEVVQLAWLLITHACTQCAMCITFHDVGYTETIWYMVSWEACLHVSYHFGLG